MEPAAVDLALTVLRNGLKTIAATEAAWMDDVTALRAEARSLGMRTLRESGLMALYEGQTTIDEVVRETIVDE